MPFPRLGWIALFGCVAVAAAPRHALAQTATVAARAGHCQIQVSAKLTAPSMLLVERDAEVIFNRQVRADELPRTIHVRRPIGTTTVIKVSLGNQPVAVVIAQADGTEAGCRPDEDEDDDVFRANGYVGLSIDTFAADDLKRYLNPNDSGDSRYHDIAGVNFEYRVFRKGLTSLWVAGETLHYAKSTEVNCAENPELEACQGFTANPQQFLAILRNASSVEANMAVRLHLFEVNKRSSSPAAVYVQAKLGFQAVEKGDSDAAEFVTYSGGFMSLAGRFGGSHLDIGWGRSDVYLTAPNNRFKVDGLLSIGLNGVSSIRPYIQMTIDADRGSGPDSIQTFIGVDFDLRSIFGK